MHSFSAETGAALVFVILYLIIFIPLTVLYAQRKLTYFSRWTFIYIHILLRIASQTCAIAFSFVGWDSIGLLVAYLVLSVEGFFSLILCNYRFIIDWEQKRHETSLLEPRIPRGTPFLKRLEVELTCLMSVVHSALLLANGIIITGGTMMSSLGDPEPKHGTIKTGKVLRGVGTVGFILLAQGLALYSLRAYKKGPKDWSLKRILLTWPFLTVRGVFGLLNIYSPTYSYFIPGIYNEKGLEPSFLLGEYVLGALMEWATCFLLTATYFMPGEKAYRLAEERNPQPVQSVEPKMQQSA